MTEFAISVPNLDFSWQLPGVLPSLSKLSPGAASDALAESFRNLEISWHVGQATTPISTSAMAQTPCQKLFAQDSPRWNYLVYTSAKAIVVDQY